jgi:hypothetical protein
MGSFGTTPSSTQVPQMTDFCAVSGRQLLSPPHSDPAPKLSVGAPTLDHLERLGYFDRYDRVVLEVID